MRSSFGHIQYLGPDRYRVFWRESGKTRSKRIHGDRDAAERFLAHMRIGDGISGDARWDDYWRESIAPTFGGLAAKTVADYERVWDRELAPRIGARMVSQTDWRFVESTLAKIGSASVQLHAFRLWRKMCNMAVRDGILQRNPCDRSIRLKRQQKREKPAMDAGAVAAYIDATHGTYYERLILMEMCAGLRHGEAVAMMRDDVREEEGRAVLRVSKAVVCVGGRVIRKDTKTALSEREVVLSGGLARRLLAAKWPDGIQNPETVSKDWKGWCDRRPGEVRYISFGQMRSVFATLACEVCDSSLVSLMMGHSDGTTRGRNYQRSTRRAMELVADELAEYLGAGENLLPPDLAFPKVNPHFSTDL